MSWSRFSVQAAALAAVSLILVPVPGAPQPEPETLSPPFPDWLETWIFEGGLGDNAVEFGAADVPPIPPEFFGPGSDPFVGIVPFVGIPLDPGLTGTASVEVVRLTDPVLPEDPPGAMATIPIELVQLELRSVAPITVTFFGGMNPQQWDLDILLSEVVPAPGTLTATKTHLNGGTFDAEFNVQPVFRFISQDDPDNQQVIDTGQLKLPPVHLTITGASFVHELSPAFGDLIITEPTQWHPGITEPVPGDINSQVATPFTAISDGGGVEHTVCPALVKLSRCELVMNDIPNSRSGCMVTDNGDGTGSVTEEFYMDARFRANCSCCEYRQFVKGEFKIDGQMVEHLLGPGEQLEKNTFHEDCKRKPHAQENACYGHRSDPNNSVGCTDDAYTTPHNRAIGCNYVGVDSPHLSNWPTGSTYSLNLDFEGKILDVCNGTTLRTATWSVNCSGTFFGPDPVPLFKASVATTINGREALLSVYVYPGDVLTVVASIENDDGSVPIDASDVDVQVAGLAVTSSPPAGGLPETRLRGAVAQAIYDFDYPAGSPLTIEVTLTFGPDSQDFTFNLCPSDIDGNGAVDVLDLLFILGCYAQPAVGPCAAGDIDGSGTVDVADLLAVLADWGLCP